MTAARSRRWIAPLAGAMAVVAGMMTLAGAVGSDRSDLPRMGQASEFSLMDLSGQEVSLSDYRGKVVVVNFMFTKCPDYCPTLTAVLANVQDALNREGLGDRIQFLSVSIDPEHDTPEVLARYAEAMHVDAAGWNFLTGKARAIQNVSDAYGVFFARTETGSVQHNLLTTLVDRKGQMRVQYVGERFDPEELLADLRALAAGRFSLI